MLNYRTQFVPPLGCNGSAWICMEKGGEDENITRIYDNDSDDDDDDNNNNDDDYSSN